jgi:hypothetical protein
MMACADDYLFLSDKVINFSEYTFFIGCAVRPLPKLRSRLSEEHSALNCSTE